MPTVLVFLGERGVANHVLSDAVQLITEEVISDRLDRSNDWEMTFPQFGSLEI